MQMAKATVILAHGKQPDSSRASHGAAWLHYRMSVPSGRSCSWSAQVKVMALIE